MENATLLGQLVGVSGTYQNARIYGNNSGFVLETDGGNLPITQTQLSQLAQRGNVRWASSEIENWAVRNLGAPAAAAPAQNASPIGTTKPVSVQSPQQKNWVKPLIAVGVGLIILVVVGTGGFLTLSAWNKSGKTPAPNKGNKTVIQKDKTSKEFVMPPLDFIKYDIVETQAAFPKGSTKQTIIFYAKNPTKQDISTLLFRATLVTKKGKEIQTGDDMITGLGFTKWRAGEWGVVGIQADELDRGDRYDPVVAVKDIRIRTAAAIPKGYELQNPAPEIIIDDKSYPVTVKVPSTGSISSPVNSKPKKFVEMEIKNQGDKQYEFSVQVFFTNKGHIVGTGNIMGPKGDLVYSRQVIDPGKSVVLKLYPVSLGYLDAGYSYDWDGYIYTYSYSKPLD